MGQGPIGLIFTMLLARRGVHVIASDTIARRLDLAAQSGAALALNPVTQNLKNAAFGMTQGRGADAVIVATAVKGLVEQAMECSRPGAKILLFAQTSPTERVDVSGAAICVGERILFGSYSASVDVQKESADLVFSGALPLHLIISHRMPLDRINDAFHLATHPTAESLKIVVNPHA
jgi:L-iditol 2-dehydrogenase